MIDRDARCLIIMIRIVISRVQIFLRLPKHMPALFRFALSDIVIRLWAVELSVLIVIFDLMECLTTIASWP